MKIVFFFYRKANKKRVSEVVGVFIAGAAQHQWQASIKRVYVGLWLLLTMRVVCHMVVTNKELGIHSSLLVER